MRQFQIDSAASYAVIQNHANCIFKGMSGIESNRLHQRKEEVLSVWEARCLKEVSSAKTIESLVLRDSLPIYLEHLSEALDTQKRMDFQSVFERDVEGARIGKMHGADRASDKSYILTEVIFEYHILREVIFQVLENDSCLDPIQRDIVLDSIEQAVNDAAVEFSEAHRNIQDTFVNTLTHDLKNPISAAKMNAQLILMRDDIPKPAEDYAKAIVRCIDRLERMILDLLDSNRIRSGEKMELPIIQCDLEALVRDIVQEMSLVHGDRFVFHSSKKLEGKWASEGIRRAVENLILNAAKYSTRGTSIVVTLKPEAAEVSIVVHNEGNPIPESEIPSLFQKFKRASTAKKNRDSGWGLGLTLVQGVAIACKGKIEVTSSKESGTDFILTIPIVFA